MEQSDFDPAVWRRTAEGTTPGDWQCTNEGMMTMVLVKAGTAEISRSYLLHRKINPTQVVRDFLWIAQASPERVLRLVKLVEAQGACITEQAALLQEKRKQVEELDLALAVWANTANEACNRADQLEAKLANADWVVANAVEILNVVAGSEGRLTGPVEIGPLTQAALDRHAARKAAPAGRVLPDEMGPLTKLALTQDGNPHPAEPGPGDGATEGGEDRRRRRGVERRGGYEERFPQHGPRFYLPKGPKGDGTLKIDLRKGERRR